MKPPILALAAALATLAAACTGEGPATTEGPKQMDTPMTAAARIPDPRAFSPAPLRNRMRLALSAPAAEVWTLVGDMSRMPEYSEGLERVDLKRDSQGMPTEYFCHFKPAQPGGSPAAHANRVVWFEPGLGWASRDEEPNDFGLKDSLHLVTLQATKEGTLVKWDAYYDAQDLQDTRAGLDQAFADISQRLVIRFGGQVLERSTDVAH